MKKNQKKIFLILSTVAIITLFAYGFFITKTVGNVVARQNATREIQKVSSEVSILEASYMSLSSSLTLDHALTLGFHEVRSADTLFVERSVPAVAIR